MRSLFELAKTPYALSHSQSVLFRQNYNFSPFSFKHSLFAKSVASMKYAFSLCVCEGERESEKKTEKNRSAETSKPNTFNLGYVGDQIGGELMTWLKMDFTERPARSG